MPSTKKWYATEDAVTFKIYLEGEYAGGFKRLRQSTRDHAEWTPAYGGKNIQFEFIDR